MRGQQTVHVLSRTDQMHPLSIEVSRLINETKPVQESGLWCYASEENLCANVDINRYPINIHIAIKVVPSHCLLF